MTDKLPVNKLPVNKLIDQLDAIFAPRAMAVVGVAEKVANMGLSFLMGYRDSGFTGPQYAIHPTKTISNFETYPNLVDVPGPVDVVIICVPARAAPQVMADCAKKQVKGVAIFSSGFRESGTDEGLALEEEITAIARNNNIRVVGPNCMGFYCPASGMTIRPDMPAVADGKIGLISQSGGVAISSIMAAAEKGIGMSKVISYGNECDLGPPELLRYLSHDNQTEVICLYIEGTRRPQELKTALQAAASRKPVIVLKGGATSRGLTAVSSHTGAMAGAGNVWTAMIDQCGGIRVEDMEEMLDVAMLFTLSAPPKNNRIGFLSISGGFGVFSTDLLTQAGFAMPGFGPEATGNLRQYIDAPGTSLGNPLDMAAQFFQPHHFKEMFQIIGSEPAMDAFILSCALEYLSFIGDKTEVFSKFMVENLIEGLREIDKPIYIVFHNTICEEIRHKHEKTLIAAGFPVYPTVPRCLNALKRSFFRLP